MNSHPNLVSSANWQSRDLHSSPVIFLRENIDILNGFLLLNHFYFLPSSIEPFGKLFFREKKSILITFTASSLIWSRV